MLYGSKRDKWGPSVAISSDVIRVCVVWVRARNKTRFWLINRRNSWCISAPHTLSYFYGSAWRRRRKTPSGGDEDILSLSVAACNQPIKFSLNVSARLPLLFSRASSRAAKLRVAAKCCCASFRISLQRSQPHDHLSWSAALLLLCR